MTKYLSMMLAVIAGSAISGCSQTSTAGKLAEEDFCDAFASAYCSARTMCSCDAAAFADCTRPALSSCGTTLLSPFAAKAIADGTIEYNGAAASQFVFALEQLPPGACDQPLFVGLDWTQNGALTLGLTLHGRLPANASCTVPPAGSPISECDNGYCMGASPGTRGTCVTYVDVGAHCDATHVCTDRRHDLASGLRLGGTLVCDTEELGGTERCLAAPAIGQACDDDGPTCESHRCVSGTCEPQLAGGAACTQNEDCLSWRCDTDSSGRGTCLAAVKQVGEPCGSSNECQSGVCGIDTHECISALCNDTFNAVH